MEIDPVLTVIQSFFVFWPRDQGLLLCALLKENLTVDKHTVAFLCVSTPAELYLAQQ